MRIMLLSDDRKTARRYAAAAEETDSVRLCSLKNMAQVLERMFRDPFDALLSDDPSVLSPSILKRPVIWPDHIFLLIAEPALFAAFPEALTFCFSKDGDPKEILSRIAGFPKGCSRKKDPDVAVSRFLQQIGVPVSLSGFTYLSEAIRLILRQKHLPEVGSVNDVYEIVSMEMGTNPGVAEHAMRHSIDAAWIRADPSVLEKLFGETVCSDRSAPSNASFLFRAADHLQIKTEGEY